MNATIIAVGGRAPPGRNTPTPSAESHWPGGARDSPVPIRARADGHRSKDLRAAPCPAPPAAANSGAFDSSSRSSPRSIESRPTAMHAQDRGPAPTAPPAPVPLVKTAIARSVSS